MFSNNENNGLAHLGRRLRSIMAASNLHGTLLILPTRSLTRAGSFESRAFEASMIHMRRLTSIT